MSWMVWVVFSLSVYNITMSLLTKTQNSISSFVFKVLPFFLGLGSLIYVLKTLEVL